MKLGLMAMAALMLSNIAAQAEEMRPYGAFEVVEGKTTTGYDCTLRVTYSAAGKAFIMSMSQTKRMMFMSFYITSIEQLRGKSASLQIDHHDLMRFDPSTTNAAGTIFGVHVELTDERFQQEFGLPP